MNIEHLRYVLEVERVGSISHAAENLFMSQPNLSKAIKELEKALNITIFKRSSRGVYVTPQGSIFLRYANNILQQYEEIEALGRQNADNAREFKVSVPRASYIASAFTSFLAVLDLEKAIQVDFRETNALRTIRQVGDGRSGLGIIRCITEYRRLFVGLIENSDLALEDIFSSPYLLLVADTHPLSKKVSATEKDLEGYIEIVHGDTAIPHMRGLNETEYGTIPGKKRVNVYERGSQFDILSRVKGSYMWVSPMPGDLLRRNGLMQIHCENAPTFNDILIFPKWRERTEFEELFLVELHASIMQVTKETKRRRSA